MADEMRQCDLEVQPMRLRLTLGTLFVTVLCITTTPELTFAQDQPPDAESASHGVGRISILDGDVSVRRNESGDFVAAAVNAPVVTGDAISTGPAGRTELQFESANFLRIGHDSDVKITDLQA